jgi:hypothetical protein
MRCRLEDNKTGVIEIGWEGVDWIGLAQGRAKRQTVVNRVVIFRVV